MTMQVVTLTYAGVPDEAMLDAYSEKLDATVAAIPGQGFTVTLWEDGDVLTAIQRATFLAGDVVEADPVAVEAMGEDEYAERALAPTVPELVGSVEAADILGVSRQRIHQLRDTERFPAPLYELRTGPLWTRQAIEWFDREWGRKPGRPARPMAHSA
jgi:hypothetical protein